MTEPERQVDETADIADIKERHANLMARMIQVINMPHGPDVSVEDRKSRRITILKIRLEIMGVMLLLNKLQVHQIMAQLQLLDQCIRDENALNWLESEEV